MTEQESPVLYRRITDIDGLHYGVPNRDLTDAEFAALAPDLRREVKASPLFELVGTTVAPTYTLDPLQELSDEAFSTLSPADKGGRTREAKARADAVEQAAQEAADGPQESE